MTVLAVIVCSIVPMTWALLGTFTFSGMIETLTTLRGTLAGSDGNTFGYAGAPAVVGVYVTAVVCS